MASNFYQCICGKYATIDMLGWINGYRWIHCQCGRKLNADEGVFGFSIGTSHYAWIEYMLREIKRRDKGMDIKTLESWLRDAPIANAVPASTYMQKLRSCLREMKRFEKENKKLKERNEALEDLLTCYRLQKRPSEKLHSKLDRTKQALDN